MIVVWCLFVHFICRERVFVVRGECLSPDDWHDSLDDIWCRSHCHEVSSQYLRYLVYVREQCTNSRYYMLQKYAGAVCFRCGSRSHGRRHCHASVYCEWCQLDGMQCTHCGLVGHYMGRLSLCPKWRSRPAAGRTSAAVAPVAELDAWSQVQVCTGLETDGQMWCSFQSNVNCGHRYRCVQVCRRPDRCVVHFDATWTALRKFSTKRDCTSAWYENLLILDFISSMHTCELIRKILELFNCDDRNINQPLCVITEFSYALIHAVLHAFNKCTLVRQIPCLHNATDPTEKNCSLCSCPDIHMSVHCTHVQVHVGVLTLNYFACRHCISTYTRSSAAHESVDKWPVPWRLLSQWGKINDYNPALLVMNQGNVDVQYSGHLLLYYITL